MRILITGANGFLGHYLVPVLLDKGYDVLATGKGACRLQLVSQATFRYTEMDFTDRTAVAVVTDGFKPDVIIHAGAMSKPDECETNQEAALLINTTATGSLLQEAAKHRSFFIFISTDFVFDGNSGMYREEDIPAPVNYYGETKWLAEKKVEQYPFPRAIVRTVLVYGQPLAGRSNILSIVKEKLEAGEIYKVVDDQLRTPTFVGDLANAIAMIAAKTATGTWHISGKDVMTPYEMACSAADYLHLDKTRLLRVTADTFSQPARRPARTGFIIDKAVRELGYNPVSFEEGLKKTFRN